MPDGLREQFDGHLRTSPAPETLFSIEPFHDAVFLDLRTGIERFQSKMAEFGAENITCQAVSSGENPNSPSIGIFRARKLGQCLDEIQEWRPYTFPQDF